MPTIPESTDAPISLGNEVAPDWNAGVFAIEKFSGNALPRTRNGSEQRISYRRKPRRVMRYQVAAARIGATADFIGTLYARARSPLLVPWWPDGLRISVAMATVNSLQFEIPPGECHDLAAGSAILVGDIPREIASITGKFATLEPDGAGQVEPAGTWVFPLRLAMLTETGGALTGAKRNQVSQALQFEEI